jgi:hypothetical protein
MLNKPDSWERTKHKRLLPPDKDETVMVDEKNIQDLCNRIVQDFQSERIIRFGSYASGNPIPDSDVKPWITARSCMNHRLRSKI